MSVAVIVDDEYLRPCDICGRPRKRSEIVIRDSITICIDHPGFRTARELDRLRARAKPTADRPVRGAKPFAAQPTYLNEERQIFDLVTTVAPFETRDATSDGAPGVTGARSYQAVGWAIVYLLALCNEGRRPAAWRTQALAKARSLGDFLISKQFGNGLSPLLTKSNFPLYGGFDQFQLGGGVLTTTSTDQGIAMVALARLYAATGAEQYRFAAGLAANTIVNLMASDLLASGGTPIFYGPPTHSYDDLTGAFDLLFSPADMVCLWGLTELKAIAGDGTYGADTTISGFFTVAPQRLLSTAIGQIRAFWANGAFDSNTGTVINGLSPATPREAFDAFDVVWLTGKVGALFSASNWAAALRSLFEVEGVSSQVATCWDYMMSFTSNPATATPAGASAKTILKGTTGTYVPTIAPATDLGAGINASSFYDFGAAGLMAPIQATRNPGALADLKAAIAIPRARTAEGTPRDGRTDYLGRLGRSGLSFQPWTATSLRQESVTRAAQVGAIYRYGQAFGGDE